MANRRFTQFQKTLENGMVTLWMRATIGATGAPTLVAAKSKGVASIARTGVGAYTITLQDQYMDLFTIGQTITFASGSPVSGVGLVVRSQDVVGAKTILVAFTDASYAAAELASGVTLGMKFDLKNSGV